jgi:hypothetical protein
MRNKGRPISLYSELPLLHKEAKTNWALMSDTNRANAARVLRIVYNKKS